MRFSRSIQFLLLISAVAWGQGGRGRGTQATGQQPAPAAQTQQQPAPADQPGRGGRGTNDFYNYDTSANVAFMAPAELTPAEIKQKATINGESIAYAGHAGYVALRNATSGLNEAYVFYTSYGRDGVTDMSSRPIIFFLAGGPGVSSAWQEFGGLGPKRMKADGSGWAENPASMLPSADLVFVNPVGTAFSRADFPNHATNYWNTPGDTASLGEFVRTFITKHGRRTSPLFLAGEDLSTGRAANLAAYLIEHEIPVHGVILFSMTMSADSGAGDTQYLTLLPSLTMSAWVHKKLSPDLQAMSAEQISQQARQFASREYLRALYKGDRLTPEERTKVIANLARLTGLSKSFIVANNLRVSLDRFNQELMRDQHRELSASDARVAGFQPPSAGGGRGGGGGGRGGFGGPPAIDFNMADLSGKFLASYESYLRNELTFKGQPDGIYYLNSGGVGAFTSTGADDASLSAAFARQPSMRLFVAVNLFDLSAPFYATEFTLAHLSVSPEVRGKNITVSHYEAGRMTYLDSKESVKLQRDLANFISAK
jgi:carboxypeptidase C (cathepsin A)